MRSNHGGRRQRYSADALPPVPTLAECEGPFIGLKFELVPQLHYCTCENLDLKEGDMVIARTSRAKEMAMVKCIRDGLPSDYPADEPPFVRKILRKATEKDFERERSNRQREEKAFAIAKKKIEQHKLEMQLIKVHYLFDHSRIIFYFKAASKVDFRALVKTLASIFKTRIELRQIGVRDEAQMLGGIGPCGRICCCASFMSSFAPVTVKMAKVQHLSLNPTKISGLCGRLQCCLAFEERFYEEALKGVPSMGAHVSTPKGRGKLIKANIFTETASVLLEDSTIVQIPLDQIEPLKPRRKRGESRGEADRTCAPESAGRNDESEAPAQDDAGRREMTLEAEDGA